MADEKFRRRENAQHLDAGARVRIIPSDVGSIRDFGVNQSRVQQLLETAGRHGFRVELLECLSNIRDGGGRFHFNPFVRGDAAVTMSLDVLEQVGKNGMMPDLLFFMKEFPGLLKPSPNERPQGINIVQALGDAILQRGWNRKNYEKMAASYRRFCDAYQLDGLDPQLALTYSEHEYAVHSEGRVYVNMGNREFGFQGLYERRNRIFPHEIANYVVDRETGVLSVEDQPEKMLDFWGDVFRKGVSTKNFVIPAVDFSPYIDKQLFDPVWVYNNARELVADKIALDLGSRYVDRDNLDSESAGKTDREIYLRAYTKMVSTLPGSIKTELGQLGFDDIDNNAVIRPCRYGAIMRVNATAARESGLRDVAVESERLSEAFRMSFMDSPMLRASGLELYGGLMPVMEQLYGKTSYRP